MTASPSLCSTGVLPYQAALQALVWLIHEIIRILTMLSKIALQEERAAINLVLFSLVVYCNYLFILTAAELCEQLFAWLKRLGQEAGGPVVVARVRWGSQLRPLR